MSYSDSAKTGAEVLLEQLECQGVECIFASPIAVMAPVWEAIARHGDEMNLRYFRCRHELLAVSLASGYYKATGRSQIVFLPTSPGLQNGSPSLHTATGTHPDLCAVARHRPLVVYSSARHATPKPSSSGETRPHPAELVDELRRASPHQFRSARPCTPSIEGRNRFRAGKPTCSASCTRLCPTTRSASTGSSPRRRQMIQFLYERMHFEQYRGWARRRGARHR